MNIKTISILAAVACLAFTLYFFSPELENTTVEWGFENRIGAIVLRSMDVVLMAESLLAELKASKILSSTTSKTAYELERALAESLAGITKNGGGVGVIILGILDTLKLETVYDVNSPGFRSTVLGLKTKILRNTGHGSTKRVLISIETPDSSFSCNVSLALSGDTLLPKIVEVKDATGFFRALEGFATEISKNKYDQAIAQIRSGDFENALELVEQAHEFDKQSPAYGFAKGYYYYKNQKYEEAYPLLKEAYHKNFKKSQSTILLMRTILEGALGSKDPSFDKVEEHGFQERLFQTKESDIEGQEDLYHYFLIRGIMAISKNNHENAQPLLKKAIALNNADYHGYYFLGMSYAVRAKELGRSGDSLAAARLYRESVICLNMAYDRGLKCAGMQYLIALFKFTYVVDLASPQPEIYKCAKDILDYAPEELAQGSACNECKIFGRPFPFPCTFDEQSVRKTRLKALMWLERSRGPK